MLLFCKGDARVKAHLGNGVGKPLLGLAQDARLGVVVALPGQLSRGAVAQPHIDACHRIRHILARTLRNIVVFVLRFLTPNDSEMFWWQAPPSKEPCANKASTAGSIAVACRRTDMTGGLLGIVFKLGGAYPAKTPADRRRGYGICFSLCQVLR